MNNMECQRVTLLVLLDLSTAFDTVCLETLSEIFEKRVNITGNVLNWFQSYLENRDQRIIIYDAISKRHKLKYGVPQGSCAVPVIFLGYLSSLYDIINRYSGSVQVGGYADDHQLYIACNPNDNNTKADTLESLQSCISDVRSWMLSHKLKIKDAKTEFMILGTKQQLTKLNISEIYYYYYYYYY